MAWRARRGIWDCSFVSIGIRERGMYEHWLNPICECMHTVDSRILGLLAAIITCTLLAAYC